MHTGICDKDDRIENLERQVAKLAAIVDNLEKMIDLNKETIIKFMDVFIKKPK